MCFVFVHTVVRIPYCNKLSEPPFDIASKFAIEPQAPSEEPSPSGALVYICRSQELCAFNRPAYSRLLGNSLKQTNSNRLTSFFFD